MKFIFNAASAADNHFLCSVVLVLGGFFLVLLVTVYVYDLCVCRCLAYSKELLQN